MKDLELTVYPQSGFGYTVPLRVWSPVSCDPEDDFQVTVSEDDIQKRIESKRLTAAELAAEYWAAHGEANATMTGNTPLRFSRRHALRRFATLPNYDEVDQ